MLVGVVGGMTGITTVLERKDDMQINETIIDHKYSRLNAQYAFKSRVLECMVIVPKGFVYDHESVPFIKGTSHRGGLVHDYLCRTDSIPVVTKKQASDVYLEVMKYRGNSWWRRYLKSWFVKYTPLPKFFHVLKVSASYEDITGRKEIK